MASNPNGQDMTLYPSHDRNAFSTKLKQVIGRTQKQGGTGSLLIVRMDRLREINQEFGYAFGDEVIHQVAKILQKFIARKDYLFRLADQEYGIILPRTRGAGEVILLANKLISHFQDPIHVEDIPFKCRIRIGMAHFPDHATDTIALMQCADRATQKAKELQTRYAISPPIDNSDTTTFFVMENELERDIASNRIRFRYQPKVDLQSGSLIGFEVLSRWKSERWGIIRPDKFIALAERSELITTLTVNCLTRTLKQFSDLQKRHKRPELSLSVNLSARILNHSESLERIIQTVEIWCDRPETLIFEITEGSVIDDPAAALTQLNRLHGAGIRISIDDFGTGYSSLAYLKKIPVDELKIDKSFILDILTNPDDAIIVQSIIDLAKNFGLDTVAEGLESLEVWRRLQDMGCGMGQGFYISKPLRFTDIDAWITTPLARVSVRD